MSFLEQNNLSYNNGSGMLYEGRKKLFSYIRINKKLRPLKR